MVVQELKTINPSLRQVGIFNVRGGGEDLPKQPPAIVNPGAIRRATRARGEEASIPQVEIYVDDQGLAGQEPAPERVVTKAQREAKKRLGTRKEVIEAEKEVLEKKLAKSIAKEEVEKVVEKGVEKKIIREKKEVPALTDRDREEMKTKRAESKRLKAEAEAKTEQAKSIVEMYKARTKYLEFVNQRAKDIQRDKGVGWKDAKSDATDEWKSNKIPAGYLTEVSISSADQATGRKGKKSDSDGTIDMKIKKKEVKVETIDGGSSKKPVKINLSEETKARLEKEKKEKEKDEARKKYDEQVAAREKEKAELAKERRQQRKKYGMSQRTIVEYVEGLEDSDLEKEFRMFKPRAKLPSAKVMRNTIIKGMGGEVYGGKRKFGTSEESST